MRKIREVLIGTSIMWLPILALAIANWLSQIVTADMVMTGVKVIGLLGLITVIVTSFISKK